MTGARGKKPVPESEARKKFDPGPYLERARTDKDGSVRLSEDQQDTDKSSSEIERDKLPPSIAKAAEADAKECARQSEQNPHQKGYPTMWVYADVMHGWRKCFQHLTSQSVPFDEQAANAEVMRKYEQHRATLEQGTPLAVFIAAGGHMARWQHAQSAASLQAMKTVVASLEEQNKTLNDRLTESNTREQALRARLDAMQGERIAHIKCAERNEQFIEEIERLRKELAEARDVIERQKLENYALLQGGDE